MIEIRLFQFKGDENPTIYHRENLSQAMILLHNLDVTEVYKIELVNISKYNK